MIPRGLVYEVMQDFCHQREVLGFCIFSGRYAVDRLRGPFVAVELLDMGCAGSWVQAAKETL